MDKINHALSGVEENSAHLLKMERKLTNIGDDVKSLQTEQTETAATVSSIDSKVTRLNSNVTSIRTMLNTHTQNINDNTKNISALMSQANAFCIDALNNNGTGYFGKVTGGVALVFFNSVTSMSVLLNNKVAATGSSPICLMLPAGENLITTSRYVSDEMLVVIGNNVKMR